MDGRTTSRASKLFFLGLLLALAPSICGQPGGGGGGPPTDSTSGTAENCAEDGSSAHYEEFLSINGSTTIRYGASNTGCPNHINYGLNEIDALYNPTNESIPAYPMLMANGSTVDLSNAANPVGVMRNGVALFSSYAAETPADEYVYTAFYLEGDSFDLCGGHAGWEGQYHYHSTPGCLQEQAMLEAGTSADDHSPLLGWSYDGFPVYGQLGPGGVEMKMCGEEGADSTHCLDACSGYEAELPDVDGFKYRYYMSCGFDESFFPFVTNCYRGCCQEDMSCNVRVRSCDDDAEAGYTEDYVPEVSTSLDEAYDAVLVAGNDSDYLVSDSNLNCSLYLGSGGVTNTTNATTGVTPAPTPEMTSIAGGPTPTTTVAPTASASTSVGTPTPATGAPTGVDGTDDDSSGALSGQMLRPTLLGLAAPSSAGVVLVTVAVAIAAAASHAL